MNTNVFAGCRLGGKGWAKESWAKVLGDFLPAVDTSVCSDGVGFVRSSLNERYYIPVKNGLLLFSVPIHKPLVLAKGYLRSIVHFYHNSNIHHSFKNVK